MCQFEMFFSVEHLIARDSQFALIWNVATANSKKLLKIPRRTVLGVSIPKICESLLRQLPSGEGTRKEETSKFSLYLMAQLVYGASRLFDRQVTFLEMDARAAYETCKRITMLSFDDIDLGTSLPARLATKKNARRSCQKKDSNGRERQADLDLHIDSFENLDNAQAVVRVANIAEITLADDFILKQGNPFNQPDDLLPCPDFGEKDFLDDWSADRASKTAKDPLLSDNSTGMLGQMEKTGMNDVVHPNDVTAGVTAGVSLGADLDSIIVQPFDLPPHDALPNMDFVDTTVRPNEAVDSLVDNFPGPAPVPNNDEELNEKENRPALDGSSESQRKSAGSEKVEPQPSLKRQASFRLAPLAVGGADETPRAAKRRRPMFTANVDREKTQLNWAEMKETHTDNSSLVRPVDQLRVKVPRKTAIQSSNMLCPFPDWMGKRFPSELRDLYRSNLHVPLTLEEANEINPVEVIPRGPADTLWRYDSSSAHDSKSIMDSMNDRRMEEIGEWAAEAANGIAFLRDTPDRYKVDSAKNEAIMSGDSRELQAQAAAIPDRDIPFPDLGPIDLGPSMLVEPSPFNLEDGRESRLSVEDARRRTRGTFNSGADGRPSSVLFGDNDNSTRYGATNLAASGSCLLLDGEHPEKYNSVRNKIISRVTELEGSDVFGFSTLFPPTSVSRETAARAFMCLLELRKVQLVNAEQEQTYGQLWISKGDRFDSE